MGKNIVRVNLEIVNEHPICLMRIECIAEKSDNTTEAFWIFLEHSKMSNLFNDRKLIDDTQLPNIEKIVRAIAEAKFDQSIKDLELTRIVRLEGTFVEIETKTIFSKQ